MKYKKCIRCELNYVPLQQDFCAICLAQMQGKKDDFDLIALDICPYCEKSVLKSGEEMCRFCAEKRQKTLFDDKIE